MNNKRIFITALVVLSMVIVLMTGCSSSEPAQAPEETEASQETAQVSDAGEETSPTETNDASKPEEENNEEEAPTTEATESDSNDDSKEEEPSDKTNESPDAGEAVKTEDASEKTETDTEASTQDSEPQEEPEENRYKGALSEPIAEQPVLLTSSGQSADVQMVKVLMERAEIKYTINPILKAEEIKDAKTLVIAIGGSSKGLGAAGIDAEEELERTKSIISKAKELGLKIIALHIGGEARRGELSDKFINECIPNSDYVIVVEEGDKDNLFTKLTGENNIPMDKVQKITEVIEPLKSAFK